MKSLHWLRLVNPIYTKRLERQVADYAANADRLVDVAERVALLVAETPNERLIRNTRNGLLTIADAMATGRTSEAKAIVDAMVLILGDGERS